MEKQSPCKTCEHAQEKIKGSKVLMQDSCIVKLLQAQEQLVMPEDG